MPQTLSTCTFCGAGCGLYLATENNRLVGAYPSKGHPSNRGKLCVRGWNICEVATAPDSLRQPLLRKNGELTPVSWDEALDFVASRLADIAARHGPEALAFYGSPRCANEEAYLLQKLARAVFGVNNIDHGAGVYRHNSIDVLRQMLGTPASTCSLADIDEAKVILLDGVDLARQLPTIAGTVLRAKLNGAQLIIVGERHQRLAENTDWFFQIHPGTQTFFYGALAKVLVDWGLMNLPFIEAHCHGYAAFLEGVAEFDLLAAANACGVAAQDIEAAALAYGRAQAALIMYSTSADSRTEAATQMMLNLALLCGQVGKAGAGILALSEQANSQGVCDLGLLPHYAPGYVPVDDEAGMARLERFWGMDTAASGKTNAVGGYKLPSRISRQAGLDASSVLTHHDRGRIKALWLCRYDPLSSAFYGDPAAALKQSELVVMQHQFMTETARYAHVVLPCAPYGEETVSFTSTDRRIQLAAQAVHNPASRPAWQIMVEVARRLGVDWTYPDAAAVMAEINQLVPAYAAAHHQRLARDYGAHWPCTAKRPQGAPRLFSSLSQTQTQEEAGKRFTLVAVARPALPQPRAEFPLTLVFGQSHYYWNRNVLVQHSETLKREYNILMLDYPKGFVEINDQDAAAIGIKDGWQVIIHSESAQVSITARVTDEMRRGVVSVPYFVRAVKEALFKPTDFGERLVPVRIEEDTSAA